MSPAVNKDVSGEALSAAAVDVDFKNSQANTALISSAYGSTSLGALAQSRYDNQYASYLKTNHLTHLTIGGYFAADPSINAWTPPGGGIIYFDPSRLNTSFGSQNQGLIMHELLHEVWGLDDKDIMNELSAFDPNAHINPDGPSKQISGLARRELRKW